MEEQGNEAGNIYGHRIQLPQEENEAGGISEIMEEIIPWDEWVGVIEPYYPKGKRVVRPWGSKRCCGCTCFKSGSTCLTRRPKMPSTTVCHAKIHRH